MKRLDELESENRPGNDGDGCFQTGTCACEVLRLIAIARAAIEYRDFVRNEYDSGIGELEARGALFQALARLETDQ